jgi:hypothetical protein
VVHHLLSYESILTTLLKNKFELYRCFKLAISAKAFQILQLLYDVFQDQVEKGNRRETDDPIRSFWERQFEQSKKGKAKEHDIYNLDDSSGSSSSESEDNNSLSKISDGEYTLFHYACSAGDPEVFAFIRDKCTDLPNFLFDVSANKTQETPLHWAVSTNQFTIV